MASFLLLLMLISPAVTFTLPFGPRPELSSWTPNCPFSSSGRIPHLIPDPTNCRSVFLCSNGRPLRYYCPKGQVFNYSRQECVSQEDCSKEADEFVAIGSCPDNNVLVDVLFPHPTDCEMFYQCVHGTAYPRPCPAKLHFNPKKNQCDWPADANCKARVLTLQP